MPKFSPPTEGGMTIDDAIINDQSPTKQNFSYRDSFLELNNEFIDGLQFEIEVQENDIIIDKNSLGRTVQLSERLRDEILKP